PVKRQVPCRCHRRHLALDGDFSGTTKDTFFTPPVFRHRCVGTQAAALIFLPLRQEFSDAQTFVRQGFDIKLSAR
ncbi:hypothetical protein, partial [Xanthomonas fragariae]|uniref:hypothetical protein n=1 Tax=Xanthomonas fragariae TaxID=48664 RepID=UPI001F3E18E8